jgi:hypothetical protein
MDWYAKKILNERSAEFRGKAKTRPDEPGKVVKVLTKVGQK